MTQETRRFSPAYRGALSLILMEQIPLCLIAVLMQDEGALGAIFFYTLVAYWAGFAMIIMRRPRTPTPTDIFLIKWGAFLLFAISFVIAGLIWHWRGGI
jgi:hypothetical protein